MAQPDRTTRPQGGRLHAAISDAAIRVLAEYTGRGPTRAQTIIHGDWVFITIEDILTKGERKLVDIGRGDFVLEARRTFQDAMREELSSEIEALTGRRVRAFFSDNSIDPDMGLEALLLEPATSREQP